MKLPLILAALAALAFSACSATYANQTKGFTISGSFTPDAATQGKIAGAIVGGALGSTAGFRK